MKKVISLGAGVQSSTLFLLSCKGILPKADIAIFSDTGWEPPEVYEHLERLKEEGRKAGIPVVTVEKGNIKDEYLSAMESGAAFAAIPVYSKDKSGKVSIGRRQCTREYKITPIDKYLRYEVLGLRPRQHAPKDPVIELWIGISMDEIQRIKDPWNKWQTNVYPLCQWPPKKQYLEKSWTRNDCKIWLEKNYPEWKVPRSACIGCPFHNDHEWREIKKDPALWKEAVEFDKAIRVARKKEYTQFLHPSCMPLDEVDLSTDEDRGQMNLWDNECEGMCGL
jgi:hypothetical protein